MIFRPPSKSKLILIIKGLIRSLFRKNFILDKRVIFIMNSHLIQYFYN